ncbi:NAD(P)-binding protein [Annulohypoxylon maeteangense]|uniref:NAD(P)-binding protein n=1 Tax=Annulohypoxylon maeteangense TaxID=1927788 RepID=UPI0020088C18|nr:NAD(P)-binding protein [Annulohypoxylon maeteangense]KAI0887882.1 NAD(P)-binding protein [Annulohypoxylon maeteangense]
MSNIYYFLQLIWYQLTFKARPLPDDIRLEGQTAIVTGANVGLGFEAAKELASHELSRLILGVRDLAKGEAAKAEIVRVAPKCDIQVWQLDQESWASMVAFAERARTDLDRLDIILLNAGLKRLEYTRSPTSHEVHVQTNYLGTALLSLLLSEPLRQTAQKLGKPGRMTITTSSVGFIAPVRDITNPQEGNSIINWLDNPTSFVPGDSRYYLSKLLDMLWTRALASRLSASDIIVNTPNPGYCQSSFHRVDPNGDMFSKYLAFTTVEGGRHLTDAAVRHPDSHGAYLSEQRLRPFPNFIYSVEGVEVQQKLWDETITLFRQECPEANIEEFTRGE